MNKKYNKKIVSILLFVFLSGCVRIPSGAYADSISTYAAIQSGASELNPLFQQNASSAALAALFLKAGLMEWAYRLNPKACTVLKRQVDALSWAATVNNLLAISGAAGSLPLAVGAIAGLAIYQKDLTYTCKTQE